MKKKLTQHQIAALNLLHGAPQDWLGFSKAGVKGATMHWLRVNGLAERGSDDMQTYTITQAGRSALRDGYIIIP